jgi:hydroxymethylpyrimidine/phosphomethylpyrimidine kinase
VAAETPPLVLTIAGSDPSGGAGIQADLKTMSALGCYGMAVIAALTAQNTREVTGVQEVPAEFVGLQIDTIFDDVAPGAVKTGMLASAAIIEVVAERAQRHEFRNLVVDPVMVSKSGARLLREDAVDALRRKLIPAARVLTPNIPEAEDLTGASIRTDDDVRDAARYLRALGAENVVIKGGHREGDTVTDVLYDGGFHEFSGPRVATTSTHGTGCTFASAIACYLARGESVANAVGHAREYLQEALTRAYPIGGGHGPVHHFWRRWE